MSTLALVLGVGLLVFVSLAGVVAARARTAQLRTSRHVDRLRRQIGDLERSRDQLEHLSMTDPVTGVSNYRFLQIALDRELARADRSGTPLALLLVDVDGFREVNRRHGHQRGNAILRQLAERMALEIRPVDTLARYGGEEFVVILHDTTPEAAADAATRLCYAVRKQSFGDQPLTERANTERAGTERAGTERAGTQGSTGERTAGDQSFPRRGKDGLVDLTARDSGNRDSDTGAVRLTVSVGVAPRLPGVHAATLLRVADEALAQAKDGGGDRWAVGATHPSVWRSAGRQEPVSRRKAAG